MARPRSGGSRSLTVELGELHHPPQVLNEAEDFRASWRPWANLAGHHMWHPEGILFSSDDERFGHYAPEEFAHRTLLRNDGAVVSIAGGASMDREVGGRHEEALMCGYVMEGVHKLGRLAAYLGSEHLGYWADWDVGIRVTGLRGLYATDRYDSGSLEMNRFPADHYAQQTSTTTIELLESSPSVVGRLLLPLFRALGVQRRWLPYQEGAQIYERSQRR